MSQVLNAIDGGGSASISARAMLSKYRPANWPVVGEQVAAFSNGRAKQRLRCWMYTRTESGMPLRLVVSRFASVRALREMNWMQATIPNEEMTGGVRISPHTFRLLAWIAGNTDQASWK